MSRQMIYPPCHVFFSVQDTSPPTLSLSNQFDGLFPREVLDVHTHHQHPRQSLRQFLLKGFFLPRIVSVAQPTSCPQLFGIVFNDVDSAESNHASEEGCVLLRLNVIFFDNTERSLLALSDGVDLMTAQRTMEKQRAVGIDVADGDGIRIAVAECR